MACGKPVIAFGRGGALETVRPLVERADSESRLAQADRRDAGPADGAATGVFFFEHSTEALMGALECFERRQTEFNPRAIRDHIAPFDRLLFKERMNAFALAVLKGTAS